MSTPGFSRYSFLLLASLGLLTNCKKVCDNENNPTYSLTQGQNEWSKGFVKNDIWRFRNANGYVRTYRIIEAKTQSEGGGSGKNSLCSTYFVEYFVADLERTDSIAHPLTTPFRFQMSPTNSTDNKSFYAKVSMGISDFSLPIDQVEDGQLLLAPATFGSRTYPAVLESSYSPTPPLVPRSMYAKRIFVTKAEGIVRFEEFGGTVWNRF